MGCHLKVLNNIFQKSQLNFLLNNNNFVIGINDINTFINLKKSLLQNKNVIIIGFYFDNIFFSKYDFNKFFNKKKILNFFFKYLIILLIYINNNKLNIFFILEWLLKNGNNKSSSKKKIS